MPPKKTPEELHALSRSKRSFKEVNWAIKKLDSEPLWRQDIQYQVLDDIFADRSIRFTAPVDQSSPATGADPVYLNFDQLYLEAILSSMKTTATTRAKLISNSEFATNYSKLCLLINVGRVNTTLAFYPQMKTALRTYHPVPSLQTEDTSKKEMSDAPRLKAMLKMCFLDWELGNNAPTNLRQVAEKKHDPALTRGPPTTVIEAIFLIFQEPQWVSEKFFPKGFDIWDIFFPSDMPSQPRAQAFLSLLHHILESPSFLSAFTQPELPVPIPLVPPIALTREPVPGATKENVDTPSELEFAREMKELRSGVVKLVPAIQKKEEEAREKLARQREREEALQGGGGSVGPGIAGGATPGGTVPEDETGATQSGTGGTKRRRPEPKPSYAKTVHRQQVQGLIPDILPPGWQSQDWNPSKPVNSALPSTWFQVKRDLYENRDPDYDSSDEEPWSFDLLLSRKTLKTLNPRTNLLETPQSIPDYQEYLAHQSGPNLKREEEHAGDVSMIGLGGMSGFGNASDDE
ncbi:Ies1p [Sporobolomyces koalae]|uniref:Ies1p n=1 Tax=Sporobolomyces koalae TaxID=500713 RepID=UPI00316E8CF4